MAHPFPLRRGFEGAAENNLGLAEHFLDSNNAGAFLRQARLKRGIYYFAVNNQLLAASNFRAGPGRTSLQFQCELFHFEGAAGPGPRNFLVRRVARMSFHHEGNSLTETKFFHQAAKPARLSPP